MRKKGNFYDFINNCVEENESKYGNEIREKYGYETVKRSYAKVRGMSPEQYAESELLAKAYQDCLKEAFAQGDPTSDLAQKACFLHRQWLCLFWENYSKEAHLGVTQMYVNDPRFCDYYDKIAPGCAAFLRDAVAVYCER